MFPFWFRWMAFIILEVESCKTFNTLIKSRRIWAFDWHFWEPSVEGREDEAADDWISYVLIGWSRHLKAHSGHLEHCFTSYNHRSSHMGISNRDWIAFFRTTSRRTLATLVPRIFRTSKVVDWICYCCVWQKHHPCALKYTHSEPILAIPLRSSGIKSILLFRRSKIVIVRLRFHFGLITLTAVSNLYV